MIVINDCSLTAFQWWGGAELNARMLTLSELDALDNILMDLYPNGINETMLWFEFDFVCDLLGLR